MKILRRTKRQCVTEGCGQRPVVHDGVGRYWCAWCYRKHWDRTK